MALCHTELSISLLIRQKSERIAIKFSSPIASNMFATVYSLFIGILLDINLRISSIFVTCLLTGVEGSFLGTSAEFIYPIIWHVPLQVVYAIFRFLDLRLYETNFYVKTLEKTCIYRTSCFKTDNRI